MQLKDKTIIVTGASSGIGASAARLFAAEGANLVLCARRKALLEELAREIGECNGHAVSLAGDVADDGFASAAVELAEATFGGLDGAFNNAGIVGDMSPVPEMTNETWNSVVSTNLTSAFLAAKYQIPALRKRQAGSIVFTASFVGYTRAGLPGMAAYAASKAGLIGLVKNLAAEYGSENIRINALLPGGTRTAMAGHDPSAHEYIAGLHPLRRMAEPREIAEAALFLLSDKSSFATGSAMLVDGGLSVQLGC